MSIIYYANVYARPPAFVRQEIEDGSLDLIDPRTGTNAGIEFSPADIRTVDYSSNGSILNATLWLNTPPVQEKPPKFSKLEYGMLVDVDANEGTGHNGVDYQVQIEWDTTNKSWTKTITEWSLHENKKVLATIENYTGFFKKGEKFIDLSLNMNELSFPNKSRIMFYSEIIEGRGERFWEIYGIQ